MLRNLIPLTEQEQASILNYEGFYVSTPSLSLDTRYAKSGSQWVIDRVIKGKSDKFLAMNNAIEKKKKVIIVTDFSLNQLNSKTLLPFKPLHLRIAQILQFLITEGFSVKFSSSQARDTETTDTDKWPKIFAVEGASDDTDNSHFNFDYLTARGLIRNLDLWPAELKELKQYPTNTHYLDYFLELKSDDKNKHAMTNKEKILSRVLRLPTITFQFNCNHANKNSIENFISSLSEFNRTYSFYLEEMNILSEKNIRLMLANLLKIKNLAGLRWNDQFNLLPQLTPKGHTLKHLILENSAGARLDTFLKSTPYLTQLALVGIKEVTKLKHLPQTLTSLTVCEMTSTEAAYIINLAPITLKELNIVRIKDPIDFNPNLITNETACRNLERFNVTQNSKGDELFLRLDTFLKIHSLATKISTIKIQGEVVTGAEINPEILRSLNLAHITSIELKDCRHTYNGEMALMQSLPHITTLKSINCENVNYENDVSHRELPNDIKYDNLQEITITKNVESFLTLQKMIISCASNLTALKIPYFPAQSTAIIPYPKLKQFIPGTNGISLKDYFALLSSAPLLAIFDLSYINEDSTNDLNPRLKLPTLPNIKTLIIRNNSKQLSLLKTILQKMPNLEQIIDTSIVNQDNLIEAPHLPMNLILPKLKLVKLTPILISSAALAKLINSTKENIKIKLRPDNNLSDLTPDMLPTDKIIDLKCNTLPLQTYINISGLRTGIINLRDIWYSNDFQLAENINYESITEIKTDGCNKEDSILNKLLLASKKVQNLSIDSAKSLDFTTLKLPFLTSIIANIVNPQILQWLNDTAPNVKHIGLSGNNAVPNIKLNNNFTNLEELRLRRFSLTTEFIDELIYKSPKLTKLYLVECTSDSQLFHTLLKNNHICPNLIELGISNQIVNNDFLANIRYLFPNLIKLAINNCTGLSNYQLSNTNRLNDWNSLTSLQIGECDINLAGLQLLLCKTRNITYILVSHCKSLTEINFLSLELNQLTVALERFIFLPGNNNVVTMHPTVLSWLTQNKGLSRLSMTSCVINAFSNSLVKDNQLPQLSILNLNRSIIHFNTFINLIADCNKEISLLLNKTNFQFQNERYDSLCLPNLQLYDFQCTQSNLPIPYNLFFSKMANLKEINIDGLDTAKEPILNVNTTDDIVNYHTAFNNIKSSELIISHCNLNIGDIIYTLINLKDLLKLTISSSKIRYAANLSEIESKDLSNAIYLPHLTEITIENTELPYTTLIFIILSHTYNLKKITLTNCKITGENIYEIFPILQLPHLTHMQIDNEQLKKVLLHATSNAVIINDSQNQPNTLAPNSLPIHTSAPLYRPRHEVSDQSIDAAYDPAPNGKVYVKQIFSPCYESSLLNDARTYRLFVSKRLKFDGAKIIPIPFAPTDDDLSATNVITVSDLNSLISSFKTLINTKPTCHRIANTELYISTKWQLIPAYRISDELLQFYTDYPHPYEIRYCEEVNFYYIKGSIEINRPSHVQYIIKFNDHPQPCSLPKHIYELYNRCKKFKHARNDLRPPTAAKEVLAWRYKHQVGSCQNRSFVLFNEATDRDYTKDNQIRFISNDPHAFIEIEVKKNYTTLDLGGYPSEAIELSQTVPPLPEYNPPPLLEPITQLNNDDKAIPSDLTPAGPIEASSTQTNIADDPNPTHQQPSSPGKIAPKNDTSSLSKAKPKEPLVFTLTESDLHPQLITWRNNDNQDKEVTDSLEALAKPDLNTLVKIKQSDDSLKLISTFNAHQKIPYLFIDQAEDLQWSASAITFVSDKLHIVPKQSTLRHFSKAFPNGTTFIQYNHFTDSDMVALNCILDRTLEGEAFPRSLAIVGFYNPDQPNAYRGTDFYSRFNQNFVLNKALSNELYNNRCAKGPIPNNNAIIVNLYNSREWEQLLFGRIQIEEQQFKHKTSEFIINQNGLLSCLHLHLVDAPWHLRDLNLFWQSALQQGFFILYGKTFTLNPDFKITYSERTNLDLSSITENNVASTPSYLLNSQTISQLFDYYVAGQNKQLISKRGYLVNHTSQTITLQVTENLDVNQWSQLLDEAKKYDVKLNLMLIDGIVLPIEMNAAPYRTINKINREHADSCDVIHVTGDINQAAHDYLVKYPEAIYVDLDEAHDFSDLFYRIEARTEEQDIIITELIESDIWQEAQKGKTIVIKGQLPNLFVSMLAELFMTGEKIRIQDETFNFPGKFIFLTPDSIPCALYQTTLVVNSKFQDKKYRPILNSASSTTQTLAKSACHAYEKRRFSNISQGLNESHLLFYTGPTGIGKSTYFLNHNFAEDYLHYTKRPITIYWGEDQLEAYMEHSDDNTDALLVIDEANLSAKRLSYLKSLQGERPHVLKNGHYYTKKPQHKGVILIGNSHNYGGVRQQKEFFDSHTLRVECEMPNHAYLYYRVLRNYISKPIAEIFLAIYDEINQMGDKKQVIVTARHLAMMAKMYTVWQEQFKSTNLSVDHIAIAAAIATMGDAINSLMQTKLLSTMKKIYSYDDKAVKQAQLDATKSLVEHLASSNHCFLPSRYPIIQLLETFFSLRKKFPNEVDFGILLEGDSGAGKSKLVVSYAKARGVDLLQITPGKNLDGDIKKLINAKKENICILIDEINAGGARLEQTINTLDTGIIVTQNPSNMAGRQPLSPAMQARFTICKVPLYSKDELTVILMKKCKLTNLAASSLSHDFTQATRYANQHALSPKPNLRAFINDIKNNNIKARAPLLIKKLLTNFDYWRTQTVGLRCDIPEGIFAMLGASTLEEIQTIAKKRLKNEGLSFFSSLFRSADTHHFYKLIASLDEEKLTAFLSHQKAALTKLSVIESDAWLYPPVHIMR